MKGGRYDGASLDDAAGSDSRSTTTPRPATTETGSESSLLTINSNSSSPSDPPSPNYVPVGGQAPQPVGGGHFVGQQQPLPVHFAWRRDTHTPPAIRG